MRKRKIQETGPTGTWLISYGDLMTLLLSFFVLLLSMTNVDSAALARLSMLAKDHVFGEQSGPGRIPERIQLIVKMLKDPAKVLGRQKRLKELLFPLDLLPKDMPAGKLDRNLEILAHPEGVVIVLTEGLLFEEGRHSLSGIGKSLLATLLPVIQAVNADVNISGHANSIETDDGYELSFLRAASVLDYFLHERLPAERFSVSGYGADRPLYPNSDEEQRRKNRRVEILIKSTPRVAGYT